MNHYVFNHHTNNQTFHIFRMFENIILLNLSIIQGTVRYKTSSKCMVLHWVFEFMPCALINLKLVCCIYFERSIYPPPRRGCCSHCNFKYSPSDLETTSFLKKEHHHQRAAASFFSSLKRTQQCHQLLSQLAGAHCNLLG